MGYSEYVNAVLLDQPTAFYPATVDDFGKQAAPLGIGPTLDLTDGTLAPRTAAQPVPMPGCPPVLDLNGSSSRYSTNTAVLNTSAVTLEAWVLFAATPGGAVVIASLANSGNPLNAGLRYLSGNFEVFIGDTVGNDFLKAAVAFAPTLGRWTHVVGTTDGARAVVFADGVPGAPDTTTAGSRATSTTRVFVGRNNGSFTDRPTCSVGLFSVYARYDPLLAMRHYNAARRSPRDRRRW